MNPLFHTDFSISDSLKNVRKSVLIYETIIVFRFIFNFVKFYLLKLRTWKKEFLNNASAVFDDKREENLKDKLAEERKEKAEYAKKVGQLTMQVDWLKKKSEEICGPDYESKFSPKPFDD